MKHWLVVKGLAVAAPAYTTAWLPAVAYIKHVTASNVQVGLT
jgi:hypothetical protein